MSLNWFPLTPLVWVKETLSNILDRSRNKARTYNAVQRINIINTENVVCDGNKLTRIVRSKINFSKSLEKIGKGDNNP